MSMASIRRKKCSLEGGHIPAKICLNPENDKTMTTTGLQEA